MEFKKSNEINKKELFWNKDDLFKITINNNLKNNNEIPQEFFLDKLNEHYILYKEKWNNENKEWKEFWKNTNNKNNKNNENKKIINPENQFIRSPLTIIDAPWGAGKTFFIEQLVKEWDCILSDKPNIKFKNIVVIDLWQYFYHNTDPVLQFTNLFYKNVIQFLLPEVKWKRFIKFLSIFMPIIENNKYYKFGSKLFKAWKDAHESGSIIDKKLESLIEKKIEPTIVVLDNIERLENYSMEIIKIIRIYSCFPNFMFVLPMNKSALKINNFENKGESWIDKYVSLNVWFEYQQDYSQLLKKYNIDNEYIDELNTILNQPREDENNIRYVLTIRELEKILNQFHKDKDSPNFFSGNKYKIFLTFNEWIWKNEVLESDLKKFQQIFYLINKENEIIDIDNSWITNYTNNHERYKDIKDKLDFLLDSSNYFFCCIHPELFRKMLSELIEDMELKKINEEPYEKHLIDTLINQINKALENLKQIKIDYILEYVENNAINFLNFIKSGDFLYIWNESKNLIDKEINKVDFSFNNSISYFRNFYTHLLEHIKFKEFYYLI